MDFGKLPSVDHVRFALPADDELTRQALSPPGARPLVRVGCPVWSKKEWIGTWIPKGTPVKEILHHYSRQFSTVEMNNVFYGIPDPKTVQGWRDATPEGFRFCPKFFQGISHGGDLEATGKLTQEFCSVMRTLENRLGLSFLQLPPHFGPEQIRGLETFLKRLPRDYEVAVEFRHPGWFEHPSLKLEAWDLLYHFKATAVITDVAGRRDVLHSSLPSPRAMVRFVGNDLHASDYTRIDAWVEKLAGWFAAGLRELYFFVHETDDTHAPELAAYFIEKLNARCKLSIPVPQKEQLTLF